MKSKKYYDPVYHIYRLNQNHINSIKYFGPSPSVGIPVEKRGNGRKLQNPNSYNSGNHSNYIND